jgi:S1-C subfamily serine protease
MTPFTTTAAERELAAVTDALREITVGVHGTRGPRRGEGAGVIWHPDGLVVTNAHCVRQERVAVRGPDGGSFDANDVKTNIP